MLMTKIGVTNNGCGGVHLLAGHFDLHIAGYSAVSSEMRSSEYSENVERFAISHPYVSIVDLDDEYENGDVELINSGVSIKYGATDLVAAYTPAQGEPVWDMDEKLLYVGDGVTAGGIRV